MSKIEEITSEGNLPTKPISGSWLEDAKALLAMGARSIDRATVAGLIEELQSQIGDEEV